MFLNPLWSVAVLVGLVVLYFVVRYKHGGPLLENNANVDSFLGRWTARLIAFRSWVATSLAGIALALPDLIANVAGQDLTWLVGEAYKAKVAGTLALFLAVNSVMKTKPDGQKAP